MKKVNTQRLMVSGFTLVEMLVTISIASFAVIFFSQLLLGDMQRKRWDLTVNDLMTLNRAVSLYYIENEGLWPGETTPLDDGCANIARVKTSLQSYLPVFDFQYENLDADGDDALDERYRFSCDEENFIITTQFLGSIDGDRLDPEAANYIASGLPIAGVQGEEVVLHVIKPRMQYATRVTQLEQDIDDLSKVAVFNKNVLSCGNRKISVQPMGVCVEQTSNLGGYRINILETDETWEVSVLARTDVLDSQYGAINECDDRAITVQALVFCQD